MRAKKNSSLDDEVSKFVEQLYGKIVQPNVRDFIEMTSKQQNEAKSKRTSAKLTDKP